MTEALAKQAELEALTGEDFKKASDRMGLAPIAELSPAHYAVIEALLENPRISASDLGAMHGYSAGYISKLRRTPIFVLEYEARVEDAYKQFRQGLVEKVSNTTADALLAISEILTSDLEDVTAKEKIAAAKLLFDGDAFSLFKGATSQVQPASVSVNVDTRPSEKLGVTQEMLNAANASMSKKFADNGDIVDGEVSTDTLEERDS